MNIIDIFIILLAISSLVRGYRIGLVRQAGSTIGFVGGLFAGSYLANLVIGHVSGSVNKSLVSLLIVLSFSFLLMTVGELYGVRAKQKLTDHPADRFDGGLGSVMAIGTLLFAVWLIAAIVVVSPANGLGQSIRGSRIIAALDRELPPATKVLSTLNKLIDPNGFPRVFSGLEPSPTATGKLPSLGSLDSAVQATRASVVKVEGTGCGGIVEGSGFVVASDKVVTNAHVVAGVASPKVLDSNGVHNTRVVWFDANLDLAVLEVHGLAGKPLVINTAEQATGTPGVVLGYPGGGNLTAQPASVMDRFTALGRNIYDQGTTSREVYSLQAKVIPGNSGGPLVGADGRVLGIVFATSTTYNNVGYALTGHQVAGELVQAERSATTHSTGSCSQ